MLDINANFKSVDFIEFNFVELPIQHGPNFVDGLLPTGTTLTIGAPTEEKKLAANEFI